MVISQFSDVHNSSGSAGTKSIIVSTSPKTEIGMPRARIGIVILKKDKILLGKRKSSHGKGVR
jgi:hypothetical protein